MLDILWGRKALVVEEDGELHQRQGKLDDADALYLRCLMRKYGWELEEEEVMVCLWRQCFEPRVYNKKKLVEFAWVVHPRADSTLDALRQRHNPVLVAERRASRQVVTCCFGNKYEAGS